MPNTLSTFALRSGERIIGTTTKRVGLEHLQNTCVRSFGVRTFVCLRWVPAFVGASSYLARIFFARRESHGSTGTSVPAGMLESRGRSRGATNTL